MFPYSYVPFIPFTCVLPYHILLILLSTLKRGKLNSHHKLISTLMHPYVAVALAQAPTIQQLGATCLAGYLWCHWYCCFKSYR